MIFEEKDIIKHFSSSYVDRGRNYFNSSRVLEIDFDETNSLLMSKVRGSERSVYKQVTKVIKKEGYSSFKGNCSCPVGLDCKHVVASLFRFLEENKGRSTNLSRELSDWLQGLEDEGEEREKEDFYHDLLYILNIENLEIVPTKVESNDYGTYKKVIAQNITHRDIDKYLSRATYLTSEDRKNLKEIDAYLSKKRTKRLFLEEKEGGDLLIKLVKTGKLFADGAKLTKDDHIILDNKTIKTHFKWEIEGSKQKIVLDVTEKGSLLALSPLFVLNKNTLSILETGLNKKEESLLLTLPPISNAEVKIINEKFSQYFQGKIEEIQEKKITELKNIKPQIFVKLINVKNEDKELQAAAKLLFKYQDNFVIADSGEYIESSKGEEFIRIKRNKNKEIEIRDILVQEDEYYLPVLEELDDANESCFIIDEYNDDIDEEDFWIDFQVKTVKELENLGWSISIDDDFIYKISNLDFAEGWYSEIAENESDSEWFDIDLGIEIDGKKKKLAPILIRILKNNIELFENIKKIPKDFKLIAKDEDGIMSIPFARVKHIIEFLKSIIDYSSDNDEVKITKFQAADLAELQASKKAQKMRWVGGEELIKMGNKLRNFKEITKVKPSKNLGLTLRDYQKEGLSWICFLKEYGLAGILADDMGLGKTLQTIAYIINEFEKKKIKKKEPILIIAPTSVIFNWCAELERIAPQLSVLLLHGSDRKGKFKELQKHHIILSTYPLLQKDKDYFLKMNFHSLILDEAQYIKNSKAKVTLIANQIKAQQRLCLTGTPIENHLGELWSMFNFLLPGYLGGQKDFNKNFRNPIEKKNDKEARLLLIKKIKPFILRRTKDKILKELPAKNEIIRHIELTKKQQDLYEAVRVLTLKEVQEEIEKKGFARSHIKILEALLRLRQICCDPRISKLTLAKKVEESAKLDYLKEVLPNLVEEGRRILIFSQFTTMLSLIEDECNKLKIEYVKLTGSTKDRRTPVEDFQAGKVPIFLISLKAGGTGLNLTAADTVIHYDPWWNPAVENQATDRAHRIGQKNTVFVYKLITKGTVEEKILALQDKKKGLADNLLNPDSESKIKISAEDISNIFI